MVHFQHQSQGTGIDRTRRKRHHRTALCHRIRQSRRLLGATRCLKTRKSDAGLPDWGNAHRRQLPMFSVNLSAGAWGFTPADPKKGPFWALRGLVRKPSPQPPQKAQKTRLPLAWRIPYLGKKPRSPPSPIGVSPSHPATTADLHPRPRRGVLGDGPPAPRNSRTIMWPKSAASHGSPSHLRPSSANSDFSARPGQTGIPAGCRPYFFRCPVKNANRASRSISWPPSCACRTTRSGTPKSS